MVFLYIKLRDEMHVLTYGSLLQNFPRTKYKNSCCREERVCFKVLDPVETSAHPQLDKDKIPKSLVDILKVKINKVNLAWG